MKKTLLSSLIITSAAFACAAQADSKIVLSHGNGSPMISSNADSGLISSQSEHKNLTVFAIVNDTQTTISATGCVDTQVTDIHPGERATFICEPSNDVEAPMSVSASIDFSNFDNPEIPTWIGNVGHDTLLNVTVDNSDEDNKRLLVTSATISK